MNVNKRSLSLTAAIILLLITSLLLAFIAREQLDQTPTNTAFVVASVTPSFVSQPSATPYPTTGDPLIDWAIRRPTPQTVEEGNAQRTQLAAMINATEAPTRTISAQTAVAVYQTQTAIALTPMTPEPKHTQLPTPIWPTGIVDCIDHTDPQFGVVSCWRGVVNGQMISVMVGIFDERNGPPTFNKGMVLIYNGPDFYLEQMGEDLYFTPAELGAAQVISASGTKLTLGAVIPNPNYIATRTLPTPTSPIIFNLTTRRFEIADGTPLPTFTPATP